MESFSVENITIAIHEKIARLSGFYSINYIIYVAIWYISYVKSRRKPRKNKNEITN